MAQAAFTVCLSDTERCAGLLTGLRLSSWQPDILRLEEDPPEEAYTEDEIMDGLQNLSVSSRMSCSVCSCGFQSRTQQTEHYKLDWHRFNLKQNMMGAESVSEEVFESMTGDISSISGSDNSDDETTSRQPLATQDTSDAPRGPHILGNGNDNDLQKAGGRGSPKIFFENEKGQLVAIYRCLLQWKKETLLTPSELVTRATRLQNKQKWAILMAAGGHFAAAVLEGCPPDEHPAEEIITGKETAVQAALATSSDIHSRYEVVVHKTFHRYTVRAKRGTAQGVRDNQGGSAPKSAGASLRRYNESQLREDVSNLLSSWRGHLDGCSHVFVRAPSYNKTLFFGGKNPALKKDDGRIRTVPFPTRRPTFKEVRRVHALLSSLECFDNVNAAKLKFLTPTKAVPRTAVTNRNEDQGITKVVEGLPTDVNGSIDVVGDDESDEEEVELVLEEVTSLTSILKEMEISVPRKRQQRKKKNKALNEDDGLKDKELRRLQAAIFTCCKTGEGDTFESLMAELREKFCLDLKKHRLEQSPDHVATTLLNPHPEMNGAKCSEDVDQCGKSISGDTDDVGIIKVLPNSPEEPSECLKYEEVAGAFINPNGIPSMTPGTAAHSGKSISNHEGVEVMEVSPCSTEEPSESLKFERVAGASVEPNGIPSDTNESHTADHKVQDTDYSSKEICDRVAAFLNEKLDPNENRFLHIASGNGHAILLGKLMANGADPSIKNASDHHPITLARGKNTRLAFSRFMGEHPHRFDYKAARIPPPLTEEEEAAKAAKMREKKKKMQRKARGTKKKEQKVEQQRKDQEEKERLAFVALSDREKRAIAAEKRLASQRDSSSRCFSCGAGLEGKVPFHYEDFRFCTMPCLKKHKQQQVR